MNPGAAPQISSAVAAAWRLDYLPSACPACGRAFLVPPEWIGRLCPHCLRAALTVQPARLRPEPPERVLPFQAPASGWAALFQTFTRGVWLAPDDFTPANLQQRLIPLYWPVWLVDARLSGEWQAEIGYDYQVKSSQDSYAAGGWRSRELIETRIRWEPRLGQITRRYANRPAPAIADRDPLARRLGPVPFEQARPYDPASLQGAALRIPDLPPGEAWAQARPYFEQAAGDECRQAAAGQHQRGFTLQAEYSDLNWTQLLLPLYVTYYNDDAGRPVPVYVHGLTHQVYGPRLASPRKGRRLAIFFLAGAAILCLLALICQFLLRLPQAAALTAFFWTLGIVTAAFAALPAAWPYLWNQGQPEI